MGKCTTTGTEFCHDWLEYRIKRDEKGWRWSCRLLDEEYAAGVEPTEARAVKMAQAVNSARWTMEIHDLPATAAENIDQDA